MRLAGADHVALRLDFPHAQVILATYDVGHTLVLVGDLFGHIELHLYPIRHLFETQGLHVAGIVGIVVRGGHRRELIETFDEHALGVHVGEAERPHDFRHAARPAPLLHGVDEGAAHLGFVHEVNPAEAHLLLLPFLIGPVVDDGRHASDDATVAQRQEIVGLAELERRVLLAGEGVQHVVVKVGNGIGIAFIELVIETDEAFQVFSGRYFLDLDSHLPMLG